MVDLSLDQCTFPTTHFPSVCVLLKRMPEDLEWSDQDERLHSCFWRNILYSLFHLFVFRLHPVVLRHYSILSFVFRCAQRTKCDAKMQTRAHHMQGKHLYPCTVCPSAFQEETFTLAVSQGCIWCCPWALVQCTESAVNELKRRDAKARERSGSRSYQSV